MRRRNERIVPCLALLAAAACAGRESADVERAARPEPAAQPATAIEGATPPATGREAAVLPSSLACVSEASLAEGELHPGVWRVRAGFHDGGAVLEVRRGAQFRAHGDAWAEDGEPVGGARPALVQQMVDFEGPVLRVEDEAAYGASLALRREGLFFVGSFVEDECYVRHEAPVLCWDEAEVFGSLWSGAPGGLPARFDWTTGACVDAEGQPATNPLPVAFVRETGFGECADLSGAALNDQDFGYPDLSGWYLPGARLDGASLFFASLSSATLHGADLSGLQFGYATITGTFDDATILPEDGACEEVASPWGGPTLTCTR